MDVGDEAVGSSSAKCNKFPRSFPTHGYTWFTPLRGRTGAAKRSSVGSRFVGKVVLVCWIQLCVKQVIVSSGPKEGTDHFG